MEVFLAGATGATGRLLADALLSRGHTVRLIVRSAERLSENVLRHEAATIREAALLDLSDQELRQCVADCHAVVSCLGHNMTLKGIYGRPRRLVRDATQRLCEAVRVTKPTVPVKLVLMNTTGNRNCDLNERQTLATAVIDRLLRWLLPPHADNVEAAEFLRTRIGQSDPSVEWVAVRPDSLVDEDAVASYSIHKSPIRDPIFDSGKTSRINVANFMARLIEDEQLWDQWKGQMPVIYNKED